MDELELIRQKKMREMIYARENKVIVYSTTHCPYCKMAKEYLTQRNVKFEDVDVGADRARAMEMVRKSGQMGVPVLDINGQIIVGFNKPAIDAALSVTV